jgi:hypothetical protein
VTLPETLKFIRDMVADQELTQSMNEALDDAAAELEVDPCSGCRIVQLQIIDRAIENCPS